MHQTRDNWEPFMAAAKIMDSRSTPDEEFDGLVESVIDLEPFLGVIASRVLMNDEDGLFVGNGHNGYVFWDPRDGRLELVPQDMGVGWRAQRGQGEHRQGTDLLWVFDPHVRRMLSRPKPQRVYYQVLHGYIEGYWSAETVGPYLDALQKSAGVGASLKSFIGISNSTVRRKIEPFTTAEFRILTNDGLDFTTDAASVVLEGGAPVQVASFFFQHSSGALEPFEPEWLTATEWRAVFALRDGENQFQFFGLNRAGDPLHTAEIGITRTAGLTFIRGDADGDLNLDVVDAVTTLFYLFGGGPLPCLDAADTDDNGKVELSDALAFLNFYFRRGQPPPAPFPDPGTDPTADALPCGR
jgi:hypothetical protein